MVFCALAFKPKSMDTLLLNREDVVTLLKLDECIVAVEEAFKLHAEGKALPPKVLGIHTPKGGSRQSRNIKFE